VLNPRSGTYEQEAFESVLKDAFGDDRHSYQVHEISGREDVARTVRDAIAEGFTHVVAAGGDGTVAAVAAGLVGSDVPMGIIPSGTGNALARELGIPLGTDEALKLVMGEHDVTRVDALRANGGFYLLSVSVGLTSAVMEGTEREQKRRFGRLAYIWEGIRLAAGYQPHRFSLSVDGQRRRIRASEVIINNASRVGGSAVRWGPRVRPDDGQVMICTVYARSFLEFLKLTLNLIRSVFYPSKRRDPHMRCNIAREHITIDADERLTVQADGEVIGHTPVDIEIMPGAVHMIVPRDGQSTQNGRGDGGVMLLDRMRQTIDRQEWLDTLSEGVQNGVQHVYQRGRFIGGPVKDALHGVWLGHPLHPLLTDVTIGMWISTAALDAVGTVKNDERLDRCARITIATGLLSSLLTAAAGITDWLHLSRHPRRVGMLHALINTDTLILYGLSLFLRRRGRRAAGRRAAWAGLAAASVAAYLGSELVYVLRSGVNHAAGQRLPGQFTPVLALSNLPEGELRRVEVGGTPIVLARHDGGIHAMVATCAHLGGPLDKGVMEGDSIACPWHGTRYSLQDGSVMRGPSVYPQPVLETRVLEGQIEVRAMPGGEDGA
jgi:YegS/Rv2252/BmrU family lipid kinase